ncbi:MAG: hypothetical protein GX868_10465, partial [Actinobacteria bacterium]|nr:hypothetical protein [Actinomycetota bacterium]
MSSFRTVRLTGRSRARRIRERLLRSPVLYWCGVAVLALFTAVAVRDATTGHEAQRSVVVARRDLAAGEPLAENTERRTVPAALVPAGALEHVDPALRSTEAIAAGEIIIERRTSAAPSALAATLADDTAALAVADAADPGALPLAVGDRV